MYDVWKISHLYCLSKNLDSNALFCASQNNLYSQLPICKRRRAMSRQSIHKTPILTTFCVESLYKIKNTETINFCFFSDSTLNRKSHVKRLPKVRSLHLLLFILFYIFYLLDIQSTRKQKLSSRSRSQLLYTISQLLKTNTTRTSTHHKQTCWCAFDFMFSSAYFVIINTRCSLNRANDLYRIVHYTLFAGQR